MTVSAVYILDVKGKILLSRNYRGDIPVSCVDRFAKHILQDDESTQKPVWADGSYTYIYIKHNNIYLMAVTRQNSNAAVVMAFLYKMVHVFESYFNKLTDESVRDNFVITYELLDEMMDFGYPQSTEAKILKQYICVEERHKLVSEPPVAVTNAVSWREEGIRYKKNEIFLDVVEKVNLLVSSNGSVLKSEIVGCLRMRSQLSGMPELKLGLNDRILMQSRGRSFKGKTVDMDDVSFHQCVHLSRFENDRTISFIPPDGDFNLMEYRLNAQVRPLISIEAHMEPRGTSKREYLIKAKSNFKRRSTANGVAIRIPVPPDAAAPHYKTTIGKVEYRPAQDCLIWRIKQFHGQKEYLMRAQFVLPSVQSKQKSSEKVPISVEFEIPYFTISGIQVRYLKIIEKSGYAALPWVRYITQNGDYQIRMS